MPKPSAQALFRAFTGPIALPGANSARCFFQMPPKFPKHFDQTAKLKRAENFWEKAFVIHKLLPLIECLTFLLSLMTLAWIDNNILMLKKEIIASFQIRPELFDYNQFT